MDKKDHIIGWLRMVLSLEPGRLTETFYLDKKKQIFFSIHFADYAMFTEDLEIDPAVSTGYSQESEQAILDWFRRLDNNDSSIVRVPQRGITDRNLREIEANEFIRQHNVDLETAFIWEFAQEVSVKVDLTAKTEGHSKATKKWWQFWK